jgi:hypothetical protein
MPVGVASNFGSRIKLKAEVAMGKHRLHPPSPRCLVCRRSAAALIQPNTSSAGGHEGRVIEESEKPDRTGLPWRETSHWPNARFQMVQDRGDHHRRHRITPTCPQRPVQPRQVTLRRQKRARCLERGTGSVIKWNSLRLATAQVQTAPEPSFDDDGGTLRIGICGGLKKSMKAI